MSKHYTEEDEFKMLIPNFTFLFNYPEFLKGLKEARNYATHYILYKCELSDRVSPWDAFKDKFYEITTKTIYTFLELRYINTRNDHEKLKAELLANASNAGIEVGGVLISFFGGKALTKGSQTLARRTGVKTAREEVAQKAFNNVIDKKVARNPQIFDGPVHKIAKMHSAADRAASEAVANFNKSPWYRPTQTRYDTHITIMDRTTNFTPASLIIETSANTVDFGYETMIRNATGVEQTSYFSGTNVGAQSFLNTDITFIDFVVDVLPGVGTVKGVLDAVYFIAATINTSRYEQSARNDARVAAAQRSSYESIKSQLWLQINHLDREKTESLMIPDGITNEKALKTVYKEKVDKYFSPENVRRMDEQKKRNSEQIKKLVGE